MVKTQFNLLMLTVLLNGHFSNNADQSQTLKNASADQSLHYLHKTNG